MLEQEARTADPIPFVDLGAQMNQIRPEVNRAISGVLNRGDFILGASVDEFEQEFASYCGIQFGVGVDSGTSGLELVLEAFGIGPGDEVITAANTFIATGLAISHVGATPVLVDIVPDSFNMDLSLVEQAITPRTKAIIPVHLYGYPVDMDPVMELAARHALVVIEDASQAHGARYKGRRVGSIGHAGVFSLYPAKNLGAFGDAGVIVTHNPAVDSALRLARNYGSTVKYHHKTKGHNRRLDTLQAAVLRVKLPRLDSWNEARRTNANLYHQLLTASGAVTTPPTAAEHEEPVFHLYVIRSDERDELQRHLQQEGISTVIHYPGPMHLQPAYADLGYSEGDFPFTEQYAREILSLPMYPELQVADIERVVESIDRFSTFPRPSSGAAAVAG